MNEPAHEHINHAIEQLAIAVAGGEVTGAHVNYGESEDYMQGFNAGYDDADGGPGEGWSCNPPDDEPWRGAYLRGYDDGFRFARDMEADDE